MKRIAMAGIVAVAATLGGFAAVAEGGKNVAPRKVTICHKTGAGTFKRITVSNRAVKGSSLGSAVTKALKHTGDAVVVGNAACPSPSLTPAANNTAPQRITICHHTSSKKKPYRRITISSRAVTNPNSQSGHTLRGHMRHQFDILIPGTAACPTTQPTGATPGNGKTVKLTADLTPVAGATGSGTATVTINLSKGQLCYTLTVSGLNSTVTAAHIHRQSTGDIVVPLTAPTTGTSSGCVDVAKSLLREIATNPGAFYVNVHTTDKPTGQVRGNLTA